MTFGRRQNACRFSKLAAKPRTFCPCGSEHCPGRQRPCCVASAELGRRTGRVGADSGSGAVTLAAFERERTLKLSTRNSPPRTSSKTGSGVLRAPTETHERRLERLACIAALPMTTKPSKGRSIEDWNSKARLQAGSRRFGHPPRHGRWFQVHRHSDFRHPSRASSNTPIADGSAAGGGASRNSKGWAVRWTWE
jgi:hypothetical protein